MISKAPSIMAISMIMPLLFGATMADISHKHLHAPLHKRQTATLSSQGCFSSQPGGFTSEGSYTYQSSSHCGNICAAANKPVMVLYDGNMCGCGDLLPAAGSESSGCTQQCTGYTEPCGGSDAYTVFLTGVDNSVGSVVGGILGGLGSAASEAISPSAAAGTSVAVVSSIVPASTVISSVVEAHTSVVTDRPVQRVTPVPTTIVDGQRTIIRTVAPTVHTVHASAPAQTDAEGNAIPIATPRKDSSPGTNGSTIGVAVGVVVGVILLAVIIAFSIFYARRRRQLKNAQNGHARADSLNAFVSSGGSLPGMPPRIYDPNDSRLDHTIMVENRRESTGSVFADNHDYSRRILKVANPSTD